MNGHDDSLIALFMLIIKILFFGGSQVAGANGRKVADIYWNTSNPIFHYDDSGHIFVVRLRDSVDIICPKYAIGYPEDRIEYSLIYMVDQRSYESCTLDSAAQVVGICTRPYIDQVITVVFREFTPNPGLLEFSPGRDYYFISTSDGSKSGLKNEQDGLCRYRNMRLRFIVEPWRHQQSSGDDSKQRQPVSDEESGSGMQSNSGHSDSSIPYQGSPPLVLVPRGPVPFGRPYYGPLSNADKPVGPYAATAWWNSRALNDRASWAYNKYQYNGASSIAVRFLWLAQMVIGALVLIVR